MMSHLSFFKDQRSTVIIGDFYEDVARVVICEAYRNNMTACQVSWTLLYNVSVLLVQDLSDNFSNKIDFIVVAVAYELLTRRYASIIYCSFR